MEADFRQEKQDAIRDREQLVKNPTMYLSGQHNLQNDPGFLTANTDAGTLSDGPIWSSDRSALTGSGNPPHSRVSRVYKQWGGLRKPLQVHQADLERAVPRDQNLVPLGTPDPRASWLKLMNDGGPAADPTRGVNCLDCSLSFYETYLHGRPTVAAPRTVDTYGVGETDNHIGEFEGHLRAERVTGSGFTEITPSVAHKPPADAKADIDHAFMRIATALLQGGHGSTAIIINQWEGDGWHAWNAVNHHGTLLFLDPQSGEYSDATNFTGGGPGQHRTLYGHAGAPDGSNVVAVNALLVDGQGNPMAVPNTPPAPFFSGRTTPPPPPLAYQQQANQQQAVVTQPSPPPSPSPSPVNPPPVPGPPVAPPAPVTPPAPKPPVTVQPAPEPPVDPQQAQETPVRPEPRPQTPEPAVQRLTADTLPVEAEVRDGGFTRTPESQAPAEADPPPDRRVSDPLAVLDPVATNGSANDDPLAALDPANDLALAEVPAPTADEREAAERRAREDYRYETDRARREFDDAYRLRLAHDLRQQAETRREQAARLNDAIRAADARGDEIEAARQVAARRRLEIEAEDLADRAVRVERGGPTGDVEVTGDDWERVNEGRSDLAPGPVETGDRSALTGDGGPRPVDTTRRYHRRGGLRPPLLIHQTDLERAMPRDPDGTVIRQADPRDGHWFALMNDGGPEADPTRAINCGDTVLSLFDTYMHGRPRVSAPRTFDGYSDGDPTRPVGAEQGVSARIEATTGGRFEGLSDVTGLNPQDARADMRLAESRVSSHLTGLGHGSFAFITTQDQIGRTHVFAAVNQNGTILYLDPQNRTVTADVPMHTHSGTGAPSDVLRMDALTVDGQSRHRPLTAGHDPSIAADPAGAARPRSEQEKLDEIMRQYDLLGEEAPRFNVEKNDQLHHPDGAHTIERHGPDVLLDPPDQPDPQNPVVRTIKGRIFGDKPWKNPENKSYQWTDSSTMNRTINRYIEQNWESIRSDLALRGRHNASFDAGHRVGRGYYNKGMYGTGPRAAEYGETSLVRITIKLVEDSDPPEAFILTSFPAGLG